MNDDNGITITTSESTSCEICEWREDTYCSLFYKELDYVDTDMDFNIYRCESCINRQKLKG